MRTAGLMMNDVWAERVLRERGVATQRFEALPAEIDVHVDSVELMHRGKAENFRPYLHMAGELQTLRPAAGVVLPYNITQITYSPGKGERVDAFYEFDDPQLVALTSKGYFNSDFAVPEQIIGIAWTLPASADVLVLEPSDLPGDVPVVFTAVRNIADLDISLNVSGYDLAEYFADHSHTGIPAIETVVDERGLKARAVAIDSLFSEDELDLKEPTGQSARESRALSELEVDDVTASLAAVEAQIAAERERLQAERGNKAGTPESIYQERVAPTLVTTGHEATAVAPAPAVEVETTAAPQAPTQAPSGDLDLDLDLALDLDDELEREVQRQRIQQVQAQAQPQPTFEQRRQQVARRAAELDPGDDDEYGMEI